MKKNKQIILATSSLLAIYIACSCSVVEPLFGIRQNISESLPYTYFLSRNVKGIQRNQYVSFIHPHSHLLIAKRIIGIPGDQIAYRNCHIFLNDKNYGKVLPKSNNTGLPLNPISEGMIPEGFVFVHASHPESFDSRYHEFGLIPITALKETLWPIF